LSVKKERAQSSHQQTNNQQAPQHVAEAEGYHRREEPQRAFTVNPDGNVNSWHTPWLESNGGRVNKNMPVETPISCDSTNK
jgi:hypothetical protein